MLSNLLQLPTLILVLSSLVLPAAAAASSSKPSTTISTTAEPTKTAHPKVYFAPFVLDDCQQSMNPPDAAAAAPAAAESSPPPVAARNLTLGKCYTPPYTFNSYVSYAYTKYVARHCDIVTWDGPRCTGANNTRPPFYEGGCSIVSGRSAKFLCD